MKNTSGQPSTPLALFSARMGFNSTNSPFMTPLRLAQSPFLKETNMLDLQEQELGHFQLQPDPLPENECQDISESEQEESSIKAPPLPEPEQNDIILDESNMLEFILNNMGRNQEIIDRARQRLESYGTDFTKRLFDYLANKFRKLKKTKQEMVKYCVRKSFKHITNKMRAANKIAYANMENNEVVAAYFEQNCEGDISISMPFKYRKSSEERTMNSNFLKKIFKCRKYNADYKEFLRLFPNDYISDNKKKIKSMNEAIKKCVKSKCFKGLDQYKRLPWTACILEQIFDFAKKLMEHSPYKNMHTSENKFKDVTPEPAPESPKPSPIHQNENDEFQIIRNVPKKSVIVITPPNRPLADPLDISQEQDLLQ